MGETANVLTVEELSVILGISESTIREMAKQNQIPHEYLFPTAKKQLRFNIKELSDWLNRMEAA
ncbi:MAG: helix-turn-helix domain-containing protein [Spirochaetaceae bacterium]|jgi:excisionase family DNA binding protein|nr:helix-turn-helix domain-containing protein [Spirochaetaceae bacterium]